MPASHRSSSTDTQVKGKGTVRAVINDRMATSMIKVLMNAEDDEMDDVDGASSTLHTWMYRQNACPTLTKKKS